MGLNPWPVGQTWPITVNLTQESQIVDITTVAVSQISVLLYKQNGDGSYTEIGTSSGTISISRFKPAIIQFTPTPGDVATPGAYAFRVKINWGGVTPQLFDYVPWVIQA